MRFITFFGLEMFHLNSPTIVNDMIGPFLKLDHRRQIGWNGISSPNLGVDDAVERPAKLLDRAQTSQRIFVYSAVAER